MIPARRLQLAGAAFLVAAVGCLVFGLVRRHHVQDALGSIEGVYLNRSVGQPSYAGVFSGDVLSPFHPLNSYVWLGAAAAFLIAAITLLALARSGSR